MEHYFLYENVKLIEQFKKKGGKFPRFKIWVLIGQTWVYWGELEGYHVGCAYSQFIDEEIDTNNFELYGTPKFKHDYIDDCFKYGCKFNIFSDKEKLTIKYPK